MDTNVDDGEQSDHLLNIEASMSAVDSRRPVPLIPELRRHHSPEIIDVDALDIDDVVYVGSAPPRQRRRIAEDGRAIPVPREVIHIADNEDDEEVQFIRHIPGRPQPPPVRRERIFSPPPPPQVGGIPPVPPIPQRFQAMRQRPPPGLVIPNEEPFPFEADLRPAPPADEPIRNAAPPSHHVPSMGFGGALLAGVRRMMGPRSNSERPDRRNGWGVTRSFILRWDPFDFDDGVEDDMLDEIPFLDESDNPLYAGRVRRQLERAFKQRHPENQQEPDYKPEYTHPDKPLPGFTHDFAPSSSSPPSPVIDLVDTSGSSSASSSSSRSCEGTLVCSSCRDPLILGASDTGEGRDRRKLWGLRCGHLLDGGCIEKLMKPTPPASDEPGPSDHRTPPPPPCQDPLDVDSEFNSMRSRLRPRRGMPGAFSSASRPPQASASNGPRGTPNARAQGSHRGKGKGKGKMKGPVVEAEHEWSCPVSGCGRVHLSLLMDGRWTMDEKRGAIPVFV